MTGVNRPSAYRSYIEHQINGVSAKLIWQKNSIRITDILCYFYVSSSYFLLRWFMFPPAGIYTGWGELAATCSYVYIELQWASDCLSTFMVPL